MNKPKRRSKPPRRPLLIQPDEAWIPADQLPPVVDTGWVSKGWSDRMIVCQFAAGDMRPIMLLASYDFDCGQWRTSMGAVENVTHWQPLPEFPEVDF